MTTGHTTTGLIGASIRRVEDAPLITGVGCYTEDIQLPGMLHMALLRSPYPHAKVISINTSTAKAMAGVIAVVTAEKALEPGAPLAREELESNVCSIATKKGGDVDKAFVEAEHIVRMRIASPRLVAMAMEPRGIVAKPEPAGDLTVWLSTQSPHRVRADLATAICFPEHRIRVIAPDVGGGFGSKGPLYREEALACHLALQLGRPIKWIATRREDFLSTNQGRDQ